MLKKIIAAAALVACASIAHAQQAPFLPQAGGTTHIDVTTAAQDLSLATPSLAGPLAQLRLVTTDTGGGTCSTFVFVRAGGSASASTDMPVPPKSAPITITVPASIASLSVISSATGCSLYATVGAGF